MHEIYIQQAAQYRETSVAELRDRLFLGSAKVNLDTLEVVGTSRRVLDPDNVDRLISQFKTIGCQRLDPQYHLPAEVHEVTLQEALSRTNLPAEALKSRESRWPLLNFPDEFKIRCFHGRHRIEAARKFLQGDDRWWVIDLFAKPNSGIIQKFWNDHTFDEQPLSAGEVYFNILRCDPKDIITIDSLWARIRSENERRELKRLDRIEDLKNAFGKLAEFPCFAKQMLAGNIGSILRLKYYEECINYLMLVYKAWQYLLQDSALFELLDYRTIIQIQARAPANCLHDRSYLETQFQAGTIFGGYDELTRSCIWTRLLAIPCRWLSLSMFFEDFKYLESIAMCTKQLIPTKRYQTQKEAFREAMHKSDPIIFDTAYQKVHLYVMRYIELLRPGSVRIERKLKQKEKYQDRSKSTQRWHHFAIYTKRQGFISTPIDEILRHDPYLVTARLSLKDNLNDPNSYYTNFEILAQQIANIFRQAKEASPIDTSPNLFTIEDSCETIERRYGRPFQKSFEACAHMLSLKNVSISDSTLEGGLTPFYIYRQIFLAFFGEPAHNTTDGFEREMLGSNSPPSQIDASIKHQPPIPRHSPVVMPTEVLTDTTSSVPPQPSNTEAVTSTLIYFISEDGHILDASADEGRIEKLAETYASKGYGLFDDNNKAMAAFECFDVALKGNKHIVVRKPLRLAGQKRKRSLSSMGEIRRFDFRSNHVTSPPEQRPSQH